MTFGPNADVHIRYASFHGFDTVFNGSPKSLDVESCAFTDYNTLSSMDEVPNLNFSKNIGIPSMPQNRKERRTAAAKKDRRDR